MELCAIVLRFHNDYQSRLQRRSNESLLQFAVRPRAVNHDRLAAGRDQTLLFENLQYAAGHLARAANQAT